VPIIWEAPNLNLPAGEAKFVILCRSETRGSQRSPSLEDHARGPWARFAPAGTEQEEQCNEKMSSARARERMEGKEGVRGLTG